MTISFCCQWLWWKRKTNNRQSPAETENNEPANDDGNGQHLRRKKRVGEFGSQSTFLCRVVFFVRSRIKEREGGRKRKKGAFLFLSGN